ncbi:MAG: 50S ribosomal protein L9 [Bacillota bacterium]|jgi:large subunit ribosomal protein L9
MEVVLTKDVAGLGKKGDLVSVKDGYGRNYLLPKGLAISATKGALKQYETLQAAQKDKDQRILMEARQNAAKIDGSVLVFVRKAGQGRIFGSITPQDIAAKILSSYKVKVDKRKVLISENLKDIGRHQVTIVMHPEVRAQITVEIRPEVGT